MKLSLLLALGCCMASLASARAGGPELYAPREAPHVDIISPMVPQTWAYYSIQDRRFNWDAKANVFSATVTFTNAPYQDEDDPIERQTVTFPFPGVSYDAGADSYTAKDDKGTVIALASGRPGSIRLEPTSRVSVFNTSGTITIALSGTNDQAFATNGPKWITKNHGWYLQNLLRDCLKN